MTGRGVTAAEAVPRAAVAPALRLALAAALAAELRAAAPAAAGEELEDALHLWREIVHPQDVLPPGVYIILSLSLSSLCIVLCFAYLWGITYNRESRMSRASRTSRASRSASRSNSKRGKAGLGASASKRGLGADLSRENEYLKKQIEELRRTVKDQERELFEVRAQEDSGSSKEDELPKEKKMYGNTELTTAEGMPLVLFILFLPAFS